MHKNQLKEKIKRKPEDFIVKEIADFNLKDKGEFSYYILEKINRNTLDVLEEVQEKTGIPLFEFGFSGLKDKRAKTHQFISIKNGPPRNFSGKGWKLKYIGKAEKGIEIGEAKGNLFIIKIHDVDTARFEEGLYFIKEYGFANYFGEQRFSCDIYSHTPIGKLLIEGRFQDALKEYYTQSPNFFIRRNLKKYWGKWNLFLQHAKHLSRRERAAIRDLAKHKDYRRAFRMLPKNIKLMFLFSYQSMLWNRILKRIIKKKTAHFKVPFVVDGYLYFYNEYKEVLKDLEIPYISREAVSWQDKEIKEEIVKVIDEENLMEKLDSQVEGLLVFSPGKRKAVTFPGNLKVLERGRGWIKIKFFLPSGSYATILLRKALYFTPSPYRCHT